MEKLNLPNLKKLDLSYNNIKVFCGLEKCKKVTRVKCDHNEIENIYAPPAGNLVIIFLGSEEIRFMPKIATPAFLLLLLFLRLTRGLTFFRLMNWICPGTNSQKFRITKSPRCKR
jgi:hypothetical protein